MVGYQSVYVFIRRAHDSDESGSLDGLEVFKAVMHGHEHEKPTGGYAAETMDHHQVHEENFASTEGKTKHVLFFSEFSGIKYIHFFLIG